MHIIKTAKLKVENSVQTSFRFSPVSFSATRVDHRKLPRWRQAGVSKVNDGVRADVFRRNFVDAAVAVRRVAENRNPTVKRWCLMGNAAQLKISKLAAVLGQVNGGYQLPFLPPEGSKGLRFVLQLLFSKKSQNCWILNNH
jgi:hypothetical protein